MKTVIPRVPAAPLERIIARARREGVDIAFVRMRLEEMAALLLDNGTRYWMPRQQRPVPVPDEVADVLNARCVYTAPYLLAHTFPPIEVSRLCETQQLESALECVLQRSRLHRLP